MLLKIQELWRRHLLRRAARNLSRTLDNLRKVGRYVEDGDSGDVVLYRVIYNPYLDKLVFSYRAKDEL